MRLGRRTTTATQRLVRATLVTVGDVVREHDLRAPAVVVGDVRVRPSRPI